MILSPGRGRFHSQGWHNGQIEHGILLSVSSNLIYRNNYDLPRGVSDRPLIPRINVNIYTGSSIKSRLNFSGFVEIP
jgi:hypothetical protein